MGRRTAWCVGILLVGALGLLAQPASVADLLRGERVVVVTSKLTDADLLSCSAAVAAVNPRAVLLVDSRSAAKANRAFITAYKPRSVVTVSSEEVETGLAERIGAEPAAQLHWH